MAAEAEVTEVKALLSPKPQEWPHLTPGCRGRGLGSNLATACKVISDKRTQLLRVKLYLPRESWESKGVSAYKGLGTTSSRYKVLSVTLFPGSLYVPTVFKMSREREARAGRVWEWS